ncbi:hypothetical protein DMH04_26920 [Kibdelosporangium aridum]|uniref:Uncharacterized protein n=2 Tax=Kibdelosporangium aridum TaxID=2030 RepID=A0A428Z571_KIBAR|nr:hypothetical protein DMH04_26920 [Kibdelosporangium aridum]
MAGGKLGADVTGLLNTAKGCMNAVGVSQSTVKTLQGLLNTLRAATGSGFVEAMIRAIEIIIKWLETVINALTKFAEMLKGHAKAQQAIGDKQLQAPAFEAPKLPTEGVSGFLQAAQAQQKGAPSLSVVHYKGEHGEVAIGHVTGDAKATGEVTETGAEGKVEASGEFSFVQFGMPGTTLQFGNLEGSISASGGVDMFDGAHGKLGVGGAGYIFDFNTQQSIGNWGEVTFGTDLGVQGSAEVSGGILHDDKLVNFGAKTEFSAGLNVEGGAKVETGYGPIEFNGQLQWGPNGTIGFDTGIDKTGQTYFTPTFDINKSWGWVPSIDWDVKSDIDFGKAAEDAGSYIRNNVPIFTPTLPAGPQLTPELQEQMRHNNVGPPAGGIEDVFRFGGR